MTLLQRRTGMESIPRRRTMGWFAALLVTLSVVAVASPAAAYTTTGCKWGSKNLTINYAATNGNFRTAFNFATTNYSTSTDVELSTTTASGPSFTAVNTNYGATGYEAQASWSCPIGTTISAQVRANQYYLSGTEPQTRLKVVWAHEIGHALGLNHVSSVTRVMYTRASTAYSNGVTGLTSDEIAGINALY
jgi:predicted Zn-dependent protease